MREAAPTFIRWLWIWITIAALVVVVVIGFLIGIVSSLSSIDDNLFEADAAVTGIAGDATPLPDAVQTINRNLKVIDASLKPIPDQADAILNELQSIRGRASAIDTSLADTNASLADTDASLVDTSGQLGNITGLLVDTSGDLTNIVGSLDDTSGTLVTVSGTLRRVSPSLVDTNDQLVSVRRLADRIDETLVDAQTSEFATEGERDPGALGTHRIWRMVRFINGGSLDRPGEDDDTSLAGPGANPNGLAPAEADATAILGGLQEVNKHLTSICESPVLTLLGTELVAIPGLLDTTGPC